MKEFRLRSGKKINFFGGVKGVIYELAPDNPRGIEKAEKKLALCKQEIANMPQFNKIDWQTVVHTY